MILQELNLSAIVFQILPLVKWFPYSSLSVSLISDLDVGNDKALSASDLNFLRSFSWLFLVLSTLLTIEIMSISAFWVVKLNCFAVEWGSTKKQDPSKTFTSINLSNVPWNMARSLVFFVRGIVWCRCWHNPYLSTKFCIVQMRWSIQRVLVDWTGFIPPPIHFKLIFH